MVAKMQGAYDSLWVAMNAVAERLEVGPGTRCVCGSAASTQHQGWRPVVAITAPERTLEPGSLALGRARGSSPARLNSTASMTDVFELFLEDAH